MSILDARVGDEGRIKPQPYDQEDVIAFERGYQGTLVDGTVQLIASIYTYENY